MTSAADTSRRRPRPWLLRVVIGIWRGLRAFYDEFAIGLFFVGFVVAIWMVTFGPEYPVVGVIGTVIVLLYVGAAVGYAGVALCQAIARRMPKE